MDFKLSHSWLKEYVQIHQSPENLMRRLSLSGPTIDRVTHIRDRWERMVIGKIVSTKKHPNADKLSVNTVDIGEENVKIVCGAPNVSKGMLVVVALPGSKVLWHGVGELVNLEATTIRGAESFGMLCAAEEIGIEHYPDQDGIMDLTWTKAAPGTSLVKALDCDDSIYDVEVTTNRPDIFSVVGLARETAAITKQRLLKQSHVAFSEVIPHLVPESAIVPLSIEIKEKKLCPRYSGIVMTGVTVETSPQWLQYRLVTAGIRPINNIVDITNYVMLEYGKPMHAFDAKKLKKSEKGEIEMHVRHAKKGEVISALDGKKYELDPTVLVIADAQRPVAIAGIMGGESTGVTEHTTTVVFESATFDPVDIRKTARGLNLHSDASQLFEKGLQPESTVPALVRAVELVQDIAGGSIASSIIDAWEKKLKRTQIILHEESILRFIGVTIPVSEVKQSLTALGFTVKTNAAKKTGRSWTITVPWWRRGDVTMERDLIEEVARIYGYERIPSELPSSALVVQDPEERKPFIWERRLKGVLRGAGWNEVMSYSFVSERMVTKLGYNPKTRLKISNPLSEEFVYMREDPIGSLLEVIEKNQGLVEGMRIFELAKMYKKTSATLPDEPLRLAGVAFERKSVHQADMFREVKGLVEFILETLGIPRDRIEYAIPKDVRRAPWVDPKRNLACKIDGEVVGYVSHPRKSVLQAFCVDGTVTYFMLRFGRLMRFVRDARQYVPLPKFPSVTRDVAFVVSRTVQHADVVSLLKDHPLVTSVELFDLYEGEQVDVGKKSMAYHIEYRSDERTLTGDEVDQVQQEMVKRLEQSFKATIRDH